jgi:uncharacterized protein
MRTVLLLTGSNLFMTFAWYGHLKQQRWSLAMAILISWLIALPEYCLQVPANRLGYGSMSGYQLKILQECISLTVFAAFAALYLGEGIRWNYAVSFVFLLGAVYFAFLK